MIFARRPFVQRPPFSQTSNRHLGASKNEDPLFFVFESVPGKAKGPLGNPRPASWLDWLKGLMVKWLDESAGDACGVVFLARDVVREMQAPRGREDRSVCIQVSKCHESPSRHTRAHAFTTCLHV